MLHQSESDEGLSLETSANIHTFGSSPPFRFWLVIKILTCFAFDDDDHWNHHIVTYRIGFLLDQFCVILAQESVYEAKFFIVSLERSLKMVL